jgi:hypothetical protein
VTYAYVNSSVNRDLGPYVGQLRHFQYWYRDPMSGGTSHNTSNAISIQILP